MHRAAGRSRATLARFSHIRDSVAAAMSRSRSSPSRVDDEDGWSPPSACASPSNARVGGRTCDGAAGGGNADNGWSRESSRAAAACACAVARAAAATVDSGGGSAGACACALPTPSRAVCGRAACESRCQPVGRGRITGEACSAVNSRHLASSSLCNCARAVSMRVHTRVHTRVHCSVQCMCMCNAVCLRVRMQCKAAHTQRTRRAHAKVHAKAHAKAHSKCTARALHLRGGLEVDHLDHLVGGAEGPCCRRCGRRRLLAADAIAGRRRLGAP